MKIKKCLKIRNLRFKTGKDFIFNKYICKIYTLAVIK